MDGKECVEQGAYLRRLGLDAEPPSVEALFRLHRAHVERVPWETLWIQLGEVWGIDIAESTTRIAATTRGGYCFHLNGAMRALLGSLGYDVSLHIGGVHGPGGPAPADLTNHLALIVTHLPTEANPNGVWYVDVGLGDALYEPIPLVVGAHIQGPFDFALAETGGLYGDWHFTHDPAGSFDGMTWSSAPVTMTSFASRHQWLSTAPGSGFVRSLVVQRRDATGADVLRGRTLIRLGDGATTTTLNSADELVGALGDVFGIDVTPFDQPTRRMLWDRVWHSSDGG